jgi:hypothetical protein
MEAGFAVAFNCVPFPNTSLAQQAEPVSSYCSRDPREHIVVMVSSYGYRIDACIVQFAQAVLEWTERLIGLAFLVDDVATQGKDVYAL